MVPQHQRGLGDGGESELIDAFPSVRLDEILSASMRQMTPRHSRSHGSFQSRGRSAPPCDYGVSMSRSVVAYGAALSISILFGAGALPLNSIARRSRAWSPRLSCFGRGR